MNERRAFRLFLALFIGLSLDSTLCQDAFAQAWVPPKGEGAFSLGYGNTFIRDHLFADGSAADRGQMRTNYVNLGLVYGITDRLALSADLPYVISRYIALNATCCAHQPNGTTENGQYHGQFADYRIDVRYEAVKAPFVLTPFAATIIPSHDYVYFAHNAVGRHVTEYLIGTYFGMILDRLVPGGYVQARYSYAFAEPILGVHHDRSNVDLGLGYFLTPRIDLRVIGSYGYTYGGIVIPNPYTQPAASAAFRASKYYPYHDQIGREKFVNLAGGVAYVLSGSLDVYASYVTTLWGQNGHKIQNGINVGFSWGFSPVQIVRKYFPTGSTEQRPEAP